jgi:hypothetical protein
MQIKTQLYFFNIYEINMYKASMYICSEYITFSTKIISILISEGVLEYVKFVKSNYSLFFINGYYFSIFMLFAKNLYI